MTYTESTYRTIGLMAGDAWEWQGTGSRPTLITRLGLFAFLKDYANGVCAFCGMEATRFEICHVFSAGPKRKGFVPANLAAGCLDCNAIDNVQGGGFRNVTFESIVRPDLIPTAWPAVAILNARGMEISKANAASKEAKRKARGM